MPLEQNFSDLDRVAYKYELIELYDVDVLLRFRLAFLIDYADLGRVESQTQL